MDDFQKVNENLDFTLREIRWRLDERNRLKLYIDEV